MSSTSVKKTVQPVQAREQLSRIEEDLILQALQQLSSHERRELLQAIKRINDLTSNKEEPQVETVIKHAGISVISMLGASALAAASIVNPVGTVMFVAGLAWWLHERQR
ncbi:hypothetical protein [Brasilonema sp. UFV-L1]|uniref:hypothetical protein n=1 Tax=Brasilonema sp. UFV-L1 TaxID=2234130 RepID=UPI00145DE9CD|nr:hypothetical protein [Brasilonema sp. UFV-L1]NMG10358.1 hypothetical protein [Brasilonema sp. UFV-L1]